MTKARNLSPDPVLERLKALHPKAIDLSLGRIEALLAKLGHPERMLPPVVHVAGTNGKGSVIAFLAAMLEAAGNRVHVYTSPHLVRFAERIRIGGTLLDDASLTALLERVEDANAGAPITFFEITTAAALTAFAEAEAEVCLLETGLGGRLDATNVIERPALTAITPVSRDHESFLGADLAGIAGEKAGILKPGVPCIVGPQDEVALAAIQARAAEVDAPLSLWGADYGAEALGGALEYQDLSGGRTLPLPALAGGFQVVNAGVAVACADALDGIDIPDTAIAAGLNGARWPARLQRLTRGPLIDLLPEGWELWLDGGHNPAAGAALGRELAHWRDRPIALIFGMLANKDPDGFLEPLGFVDRLLCVPVPGESDCLDPRNFADSPRGFLMGAVAAESVDHALHQLVETAPAPNRVLICGSLYLAGSVLAEND